MSIQTQKKHMKDIAALLTTDLSYIFGERESGPNGAKKQFLTKSAAFLRALGKDLGFTEMKVRTNKAGIAVSGEVTLYGMWEDGNGLFFELSQSPYMRNDQMYRSITNISSSKGGPNQWLHLSLFQNQDYERLCHILLRLKKSEAYYVAA